MDNFTFVQGLPSVKPIVYEFSETDLLNAMSTDWQNHLMVLWCAIMVYVFLNRYRSWLLAKSYVDERFYRWFDRSAHDLAMLISIYYPLVYMGLVI